MPEPDLTAELDAASLAAGLECWCYRHPEECEAAGGCAWSRELARLRARMTPEEMLREFHEAARQAGGGFPSARLRQDMLDSEVQELRDALAAGDLVLTADALADIVYVVVGTAVVMDIPFDRVLAEVHRSNMTKLIPPVQVRHDGKIVKGPGYEPPRIAELLGMTPEDGSDA